MQNNYKRIIGIRHRVKKTADNEARPTLLAIKEGKKIKAIQLGTERDELDFVLGILPTKNRKPEKTEEISSVAAWHITWKDVKTESDLEGVHETQVRIKPGYVDKKQVARAIPEAYTGLQDGDAVAMVLGGSGDAFSYALTERATQLEGTAVFRIPPYLLKEFRDNVIDVLVQEVEQVERRLEAVCHDPDHGLKSLEAEKFRKVLKALEKKVDSAKKEDELHLLALFEQQFGDFYRSGQADLERIKVKLLANVRRDAMKDRMACGQRIRARLIGSIFTNDEGLYPEGKIEDEFAAAKANDEMFQNAEALEGRADKELAKAVKKTLVWKHVFDPIKGCGHTRAADFIATVGDPRRFKVEPDWARIKELRVAIDEYWELLDLDADLHKLKPKKIVELAEDGQALTEPFDPDLLIDWRELTKSEDRVFVKKSSDPVAWEEDSEVRLVKLTRMQRQLLPLEFKAEAPGERFAFISLEKCLELELPFVDPSRVRQRERELNRCEKVFALLQVWKREKVRADDEVELLELMISHFNEIAQRKHKAEQQSVNKIRKFCGVHVMEDGTFPRRRRGFTNNWNPRARQAAYLLAGDQFVKRKESFWGRKLREVKAEYRRIHPEEVKENGKRRYTKGHIHKMAIWKTAGLFVEYLYKQWIQLAEQGS